MQSNLELWPLAVVGLLVALFGVILIKEPEEAKKFFAKNRGMLHGNRERARVMEMANSLFFGAGWVLLVLGILFLIGGLS